MIELSTSERQALRATAHGLQPVVSISEKGLTESVMKEIETCLKAHELIKVRVMAGEREQREEYLAKICAELGCAAVQHIGKLLVVWRPAPPKAAPARRGGGTAGGRGGKPGSTASTKRRMQGSTTR